MLLVRHRSAAVLQDDHAVSPVRRFARRALDGAVCNEAGEDDRANAANCQQAIEVRPREGADRILVDNEVAGPGRQRRKELDAPCPCTVRLTALASACHGESIFASGWPCRHACPTKTIAIPFRRAAVSARSVCLTAPVKRPTSSGMRCGQYPFGSSPSFRKSITSNAVRAESIVSIGTSRCTQSPAVH